MNIALDDRAANRFWAKVDKTESCWNWTAGTSSRGYGKFNTGGTHGYAHRIAYTLCKGPIADGMVIDHKCHNIICVNPDHLQAVTLKQNSENRAGPMKNSKTGVRGVRKFRGRYRAQVAIDGKATHLGTFDTIAEAEQAAIAARMEHYTNNLTDMIPAAG